MDSLTQLALGAAVGEAVIGRQVGNRALLWGAVAGTLPDLDVFVPLGDAVSDFTYHRSATHSLLMMALATPLLVWLITCLHADTRAHWKRWAAAVYGAFATHALLDSMTSYGTQLFWPLVNTPVSLSSIFIIDPLYTLPLLAGALAALLMTRDRGRGHWLNGAGLAVSSVYLGWTLIAKAVVDDAFETALRAQGIPHRALFTTPAPFNSLLWRAVARDDGAYYVGYYSLFDNGGGIRFRRYPSDDGLLDTLAGHWPVERLKWFTRGFYAVSESHGDVVIADLRMGLEPDYVFRFKVGKISNPHPLPAATEQLPAARDFRVLRRVWQRIGDAGVEIDATAAGNSG